MEKVSLLNCYDPRGSMPCVAAQLGDQLTSVAIERLSRCLDTMREYAISAAQIGINVNVLGIRINDTTRIIINPTLRSLAKPELQLGYVHPQCPYGKRDLWRFSKIIVAGSNIGGKPFEFEVSGKLAHNVQTAFEYATQPRNFDWLTPFHHFVAYHPQEAVRAMCLAVVDGLYLDRPSIKAHHGIMRVGHNRFKWRISSDTWTGLIDGLNPMRPLEAIDQLLQAVILGMSGRNSVLLFGADRFGLALSLMLSSPAMKVHVGASDWPMEATSDLGLSGRISRHDLPWQAVATETVSLPKVDAVLIDCRQSYVPQNDMPQLLKRFARCLNGMDGAFVAIHAARDPDFEAHLKENFLMVYRFEISGGPVVYIGRKYEIPVDSFWCGFSQSMSMTGLEHLSIAYACSATLLRKDGGEVNL